MSASLVPCPSCSRHVRVVEPRCPFCAAALPTTLSQKAIPGTSQRLSRAAAFAFTASLAVAGCSSDPAPAQDAGTPADVPTMTDTPMATDRPDAGAPTDTPATDVPSPVDAGPQDGGGVMPLYGAPVDAAPIPDASDDDVQDSGGIAPLYGLPPDAGPVDSGGGGLRYGAPPPPDASF